MSEELEMTATLDADGRSTLPTEHSFVNASGATFRRGDLLGRYVVLHKLGAGAMGVVVAAYDPELDRKVALKLLQTRAGRTGLSRERLQREAQALAKLNHANVVAVYDVGVHDEQVFVAMEFVSGTTLGEWMRGAQGPRPWAELVEVFTAAGRGLAAAHEAGLLHRDFKPDNVMIGDDGRVRVMDFGLAQVDRGEAVELDARGGGDPRQIKLTQTGVLMGTPAYMSIEQFRGEELDPRSDQFSFCVALYEALYGERPFAGQTMVSLFRAIEAEDIRPPPAGARTSSSVPSWLRAVVLRGLAKDPDQRWPSMEALLAALAADPVARRRRLLGLVGGAAAALAAIWGLARLTQEVAEQDTVIEVQQGELEQANEQLRAQVALLEAERDAQRRALAVQRGLRAVTLIDEDREADALALALEAVTPFGPDWAEVPVEARASLAQVLAEDVRLITEALVLDEHRGGVAAVAFSPDGAQVATASRDGTARIFDAVSGALVASFSDHGARLTELVYASDGREIYTAGLDQTARAWSPRTASARQLFAGHAQVIEGLALAPDGGRLATASRDQSVRLWDTTSGEAIASFAHAERIGALAFSPSSALLGAGSVDGKARLWDAQTGELVVEIEAHDGSVTDLEFSPTGRLLATAGSDGLVRTWQLDGSPIRTCLGHGALIRGLRFSPDGMRIASVSADGSGRVWHALSGRSLALLEGHEAAVVGLAFAPDSATVATASVDRTVRVWDAVDGRELARLEGHESTVSQVAFSPDGQRLVSASGDRSARVWTLSEADEVRVVHDHALPVDELRWSPDGQRLVTASGSIARVWDPRSGQMIAAMPGHDHDDFMLQRHPQTGELVPDTLGNTQIIVDLDFAPDGTQLATTSRDNLTRLWNASTGALVASIPREVGFGDVTIYSPDGARIAGLDGTSVKLWDTQTGSLALTLDGHAEAVTAAAFSASGDRLATTSSDASARVWDLESGAPIASYTGHTGRLYGVAFAPDGRRVASCGSSAELHLWDAETGATLTSFSRGTRTVLNQVAFSPDGHDLVATRSGGGKPEIWDLRTGRELSSAASATGTLDHDRYFADVASATVLIADAQGWTVRNLYTGDPGPSLAGLPGPTKPRGVAIDRGGGRVAVALPDEVRVGIWDLTTGEELLTFEDRIGLRRAGEWTWPVPSELLVRAGCARLRGLADVDPARFDALCAGVAEVASHATSARPAPPAAKGDEGAEAKSSAPPPGAEGPRVGVADVGAALRCAVDQGDPRINRCQLERATLAAAMARPGETLIQGSAMPVVRDGETLGLAVYRFEPGSLASLLGFEPGDQLTSINDRPLDLENFSKVIPELLRAGAPIEVQFERGGRGHQLIVDFVDAL